MTAVTIAGQVAAMAGAWAEPGQILAALDGASR